MELKGKTAVVTGANTGIGKATAIELARRGAKVVLACRSEEKTMPVMNEIASAGGQCEFLALNLGSLAQVREAAAELLARKHPIHLLIDNAGLAGQRGETQDGFELAFGTNHLGHFLFTTLLLDRIKESAPARIVIVASQAHYAAKGFDWDAVKKPTASLSGFPEYGVSKLANVLFSNELARRLEGTGVTTYALHPGVIASDVWRRIPPPLSWLLKAFMKSTEDGARTSVWCATDPALAKESGGYYDSEKPKKASRYALDPKLASELWTKSEEFCA